MQTQASRMESRTDIIHWKTQKLSSDFWVNKELFLVHCKIVAAFVLYSFSLLEAAFVMWFKIVVNTNYIPGLKDT